MIIKYLCLCVLLLACNHHDHLQIQHQYEKRIKTEKASFKQKKRVLELLDQKKQSLSLSHWKNQVLLLHIFTTWCDSCLRETVRLNYLYRNELLYGYKVIAICAEGLSCPNLNTFQNMSKAEYPIYSTNDPLLLQGKGLLNEVISLPTTYILDQKGKIREIFKGKLPLQYTKDLLIQLSRTLTESQSSTEPQSSSEFQSQSQP